MPEETVFVIGESWCRKTEEIFETIEVSLFDKYLTVRLKMIELGEKRCGQVLDENKKEEYEKLDNALDELDPDWNWEVFSPIREDANKEDIERWFKRRELSLCGEESAIGISLDKERAKKLFARQCHWEHNFDLERIHEEEEKEGW